MNISNKSILLILFIILFLSIKIFPLAYINGFYDGWYRFDLLRINRFRSFSDTIYYNASIYKTNNGTYTYKYLNYLASDNDILEFVNPDFINDKRLKSFIEEHKEIMYYKAKNMVIYNNLLNDSIIIAKLTGVQFVHNTKDYLVISNWGEFPYVVQPKIFIINNKTFKLKTLNKKCVIMRESNKNECFLEKLIHDSTEKVEYFKVANDTLIQIDYNVIVNSENIQLIKNQFQGKSIDIEKLRDFYLVHLNKEEYFYRIF